MAEDLVKIVAVLSEEDRRDVKELTKSTAALTVVAGQNQKQIGVIFGLIREKEKEECALGKRNSLDISDIELRTRVLEKVSHEPQAKGKRIAIDLGKTGIGGMIGAALLKLLTS